MISYPISERHDAGIANIEVPRDPHAIYWLRSTEKSCPWACTCVLNDCLAHVESILVLEVPPQRSVGDMLVMVHKKDNLVTSIPPCFYFLYEVAPKYIAWAGEVLLLCDEVPPLLLICRS